MRWFIVNKHTNGADSERVYDDVREALKDCKQLNTRCTLNGMQPDYCVEEFRGAK